MGGQGGVIPFSDTLAHHPLGRLPPAMGRHLPAPGPIAEENKAHLVYNQGNKMCFGLLTRTLERAASGGTCAGDNQDEHCH
jgi:hypothetical protein